MIHIQGLTKGSNQHPYLTLQAPLNLLDPMNQVAESPTWQPEPFAEPSFILGRTQNEQLFVSLGK